jgi:hypothetical protein
MVDVVATHVILLVAVATDPSGAAVARSAADALAAPFATPPHVVLRAAARVPALAEVGALESEAKAESAVILDCHAPRCARAEVRALGGDGTWVTRSLRFGAHDDLEERGRAIGLLASTLMPASWGRVPVDETTAAAPPPPPLAPLLPNPPAAVATAAPPAVHLRSSWGIDAMAGLFGTTSGVSDLGLAVGVQRAIGHGLAIRAAFKLERGDLSQPNGLPAAKVRGYGGQLGLLWTSAGRDRPGHLFWGAEADAIAMARSIELTTDVDDSRDDDLVLGGAALGLLGYTLSAHAAILLGGGVEALQEQAADDDRSMATPGRRPSTVRFVTTAGVLARF